MPKIDRTILNGYNKYIEVEYMCSISGYEDKKWKEIRKFNKFTTHFQDKYKEDIDKYHRNKIRKPDNYYDAHIKEVLPNCYQFVEDERARLGNLNDWQLLHIKKKVNILNEYGKNMENVKPIVEKILGINIQKYWNNKKIDPLEKQWLVDFMEEEGYGEFRPWVMLNISPLWPQGVQGEWEKQTFFLKSILKNRFQKWDQCDRLEYVIEPGKHSDHLHAHICLRCSKDYNYKSFKTWINKGNMVQQFRAEATKCKGFKGNIESRFACQTKLILNEDILEDTLNYLEEDKKTDDHKNDFTMMPFLPLRESF